MSTARRRFWLIYNVVVLIVIVGIGVATMLGGRPRDLLLGAAMIAVGGYLGVRTWRGTRAASAPQVVSDVQLGPDGIVVLSGDPASPGRAFLPWGDCTAVVASPVPDASHAYYVHFMPHRPEAVLLDDVPGQVLRSKASLVDLPVTASVAMVWLGPAASLPRMLAVIDQVRVLRPGLAVVDSIRRVADDD